MLVLMIMKMPELFLSFLAMTSSRCLDDSKSVGKFFSNSCKNCCVVTLTEDSTLAAVKMLWGSLLVRVYTEHDRRL